MCVYLIKCFNVNVYVHVAYMNVIMDCTVITCTLPDVLSYVVHCIAISVMVTSLVPTSPIL